MTFTQGRQAAAKRLENYGDVWDDALCYVKENRARRSQSVGIIRQLPVPDATA
jgi:hypothetical protein